MSPRTKLLSSEERKQQTLNGIKESYNLAIEHYQKGNFEAAEQELVKALKPTLSKHVMQALYVETEDVKAELLDAMYHLGQIYLQDNSYTNHHAKAAAIFQYCAGFAKKYELGDGKEFTKQAYLVERIFLKSVDKENSDSRNEEQYYTDYDQQVTKYNHELQQIRESTVTSMLEIQDLTLKDIAERAEIIEQTYHRSTEFFVTQYKDERGNYIKAGLVQKLLAECYEQLGLPPEDCEYTVMGFGSPALGTRTPWSDLDFAILISKDKEEYKEYFRNLTKLLYVKVINLGETHLRSLGIESLNNFKTAEDVDDWFWDEIMRSGLRFDSARWNASKNPFGRQGYKAAIKEKDENGVERTTIVDKPDYELIRTPEQMAEFQKEAIAENMQSWFDSDKFLVQALRSVALIDGSQELLDYYREQIFAVVDHKIIQERALEVLQENLNEFALKLGEGEEGRLFDIKQNIYRLSDRIIVALSDYYSIKPVPGEAMITVWQMIDRMRNKNILSKEGAQHLKEAASIAAELRLSTYSHNEGQREMMSTYEPVITEHLTESQKRSLMQETFYIKDTSVLHHFYYVMLPLQEIVHDFTNEQCHDNAELILKHDHLYENNAYNRGKTHARFLEYTRAIQFLEQAKEKDAENLDILYLLLMVYRKTSRLSDIIYLNKEILDFLKEKYHDDPFHPDIIVSEDIQCRTYLSMGNYSKSIECYKIILEIRENLYTNNPLGIADAYNNLAAAYFENGNYGEVERYLNSSLEIKKEIYKENDIHPEIATAYCSLAHFYNQIGKYEQAIENHKLALEKRLKTYTDYPNHPDIAKSYRGLGEVSYNIQDYYSAIKNHSLALSIYEIIYSTISSHVDIAACHHNLGLSYSSNVIAEYDKAITHFEDALESYLTIYNTSHHPNICSIYNSLGNAYLGKKQIDMAIDFYQQALDAYNQFYKTNPNHPAVANIHNNLAAAYFLIQDFNREFFHRKLYLESLEKAYKDVNPNHPDIIEARKKLELVPVISYTNNHEIEKQITTLPITKDDSIDVTLTMVGGVVVEDTSYDTCWADEEYLLSEEYNLHLLPPDCGLTNTDGFIAFLSGNCCQYLVQPELCVLT